MNSRSSLIPALYILFQPSVLTKWAFFPNAGNRVYESSSNSILVIHPVLCDKKLLRIWLIPPNLCIRCASYRVAACGGGGNRGVGEGAAERRSVPCGARHGEVRRWISPRCLFESSFSGFFATVKSVSRLNYSVFRISASKEVPHRERNSVSSDDALFDKWHVSAGCRVDSFNYAGIETKDCLNIKTFLLKRYNRVKTILIIVRRNLLG